MNARRYEFKLEPNRGKGFKSLNGYETPGMALRCGTALATCIVKGKVRAPRAEVRELAGESPTSITVAVIDRVTKEQEISRVVTK